MPKDGDLKVWHIPQVPMKPFEVDVATLTEGKKVLDVLANYDLFQFHNNIKPDYANAGGLQVFKGGEWEEWEDDEGRTIDEAFEAYGVKV